MGQDIFKEAIMAEVRKNKMYISLAEAYNKNKRMGNIAQASLYLSKMRQFEQEKFAEAALLMMQKQKFVDDFVASLSEQDRKDMNILANAMVMLADVLETLIFDTNTILKKYNAGKMTEFDKLNRMLKETKEFVKRIDHRLDDEQASFMFGEYSDDLYKLVFNKSAAFVRKLKAYEKKRDKEKKADVV